MDLTVALSSSGVVAGVVRASGPVHGARVIETLQAGGNALIFQEFGGIHSYRGEFRFRHCVVASTWAFEAQGPGSIPGGGATNLIKVTEPKRTGAKLE